MRIMNAIEMLEIAARLRRIASLDDDAVTRIAADDVLTRIADRLDEAGLAKRERTLMRRAATRRRNARAAEATHAAAQTP